MNYIIFRFDVSESEKELLLGLLSSLPFESFEEKTDQLDAYLPSDSVPIPEIEEALTPFRALVDFKHSISELENKNWNAVWEANFDPVLVDNFCAVRADFHEPIEHTTHEIQIRPKMAFGTGHHATTYMMIAQMAPIDFQNKTVLDYGCGTGILAVLARKLGASMVDAVDIEYPSYENTIEHVALNKVEPVHVIHGTLDDVPKKEYDVILANINRNVILNSLSTLYKMLKTSGILLISGILKKDQHILEEAIHLAQFSINNVEERSGWLCMQVQK